MEVLIQVPLSDFQIMPLQALEHSVPQTRQQPPRAELQLWLTGNVMSAWLTDCRLAKTRALEKAARLRKEKARSVPNLYRKVVSSAWCSVTATQAK